MKSGSDDTSQVKISDVTVVVATRNNGRYIKDCVESVLVAGKGKAEICVVDDGSTDNTRDVLKEYESQIRIMDGGKCGPGHARNMGWKTSQRMWFAFTDGDCIVGKHWLEDLCKEFHGNLDSCSSVGGRQTVSKKADSTEKLIGRFLEIAGFVSDYIHTSSETRIVRHNPTCCVLYSRKALERVDGFDEDLWPCEDLDLDVRLRRLGYHALFCPKAIVEHRRPNTWIGLWKMMRRYGFGHAQLVKKHGLCEPLHLLPIGVVALILVAVLDPVFASIVTACFSMILFVLVFLRARCGLRGFLFVGLSAASMMVWLFGFFGGLLGKQRIASA